MFVLVSTYFLKQLPAKFLEIAVIPPTFAIGWTPAPGFVLQALTKRPLGGSRAPATKARSLGLAGFPGWLPSPAETVVQHPPFSPLPNRTHPEVSPRWRPLSCSLPCPTCLHSPSETFLAYFVPYHAALNHGSCLLLFLNQEPPLKALSFQ